MHGAYMEKRLWTREWIKLVDDRMTAELTLADGAVTTFLTPAHLD